MTDISHSGNQKSSPPRASGPTSEEIYLRWLMMRDCTVLHARANANAFTDDDDDDGGEPAPNYRRSSERSDRMKSCGIVQRRAPRSQAVREKIAASVAASHAARGHKPNSRHCKHNISTVVSPAPSHHRRIQK